VHDELLIQTDGTTGDVGVGVEGHEVLFLAKVVKYKITNRIKSKNNNILPMTENINDKSIYFFYLKNYILVYNNYESQLIEQVERVDYIHHTLFS
jgi:hypothetical protein